MNNAEDMGWWERVICPVVEVMPPSKNRSGLRCTAVGRSATLTEAAWRYSLNSQWLTNQRHAPPPVPQNPTHHPRQRNNPPRNIQGKVSFTMDLIAVWHTVLVL